jgi:hypothetical protein
VSTRTAWILGIVAWLGVVLGGGALLARHDAQVVWMPELRFAGVDLIYALRRVAASADRMLLLDEIRPGPYAADLGLVRVDLDLPPAPVAENLERLRRHSGRFEYRLEPDLIYVRSDARLKSPTGIDAPVLKGGTFKGDLKALGSWIRAQLPTAFIGGEPRLGQPVYTKVEFEVPPESSILDVYTQYARVLNRGWRMRRAGYMIDKQEGGGKTQATFVTSVVAQWSKLDRPYRVHPGRDQQSALKALASISKRTGIPICVADRSVMVQNRGNLDMYSGIDGNLEVEVALSQLRGRREDPRFRWQHLDGVVYIHTDLYDYRDTGEGLLMQPLTGGHFRGSLPEFARWINEHLASDTRLVAMGGEITGSEEVFTIDVEPGSTVEQALMEVTRKTGEGWVLVAQEHTTPSDDPTKPKSSGGAWGGGYLTYLSDWLEEPDWTIAPD